MKTLRAEFRELRQLFTGAGFWACTTIVFVLCFTTQVYTDMSTNRAYTAVEALTQFDRSFMMKNMNFSSLMVFRQAGSSWMDMFIPIITAFPFIPMFCTERSEGFLRYKIARVGRLRYYGSKLSCALLGGGCAVALGYALFGLAAAALFPPLSAYPADQVQAYINNALIRPGYTFSGLYYAIGSIAVAASKLIAVVLYGAVNALPAFALSSFIRNRYLVLCFPFMMKYMYDRMYQKIMLACIFGGSDTDTLSLFDTGGVFYMLDKSEFALYVLLIQLVCILLAFAVFVFFMNRRRDLGA